MRDEDIEAALRRYRVADPPDDLSDRILGTDEPRAASGHVWGAVAAAAVLAVWLAAHEAAQEPAIDPAREAEIAMIAETLGGGEEARRYAETVVPSRNLFVDAPSSLEDAW